MNWEQENGRIEESVLSCLCYFDVFRHPLTIGELHAFLPGVTISLDSLREKIHSHPLNKIVKSKDDYFYLFDRNAHIISRRLEAERIAARRWRTAKRMTKIIKMFPYVRAVMISGDLSKNVSHEKSDIDYFILTEPGSLWISRTLLILFKKTFLLNRRTYYCLNFFRTTDYLEFKSHRDYFTATELITLKPVYNAPAFEQLLDANRWVFSFFPNVQMNGQQHRHSSERRSKTQILLEALLNFLPREYLDSKIMHYMETMWRKRYIELSDNEIAYRFRCTKDESTAFVEGSKAEILKQYSSRMNYLNELLYNGKHAITESV